MGEYESPLPKIALEVINRLRKGGWLKGIRLSNSHRPDSGIELMGASAQRLEDYLYSDLLYLHGTAPAKDSWHQINGLLRPIVNATIIELGKYLPYLPIFDKNILYRLIGIKIGKNSTIAPRVQFDYFHPELIEIGDNCLIGDSVKIWTHDYGTDYFMMGRVKIGDSVRIGSESVLGPSIIGNNVKINFGAFVYGNVPDNATAYGRERSRYRVDRS